jgi:hypothetical protein
MGYLRSQITAGHKKRKITAVSTNNALSDTTDEFANCEEDLSDVVFHAFDAVLEVPGFFPGPP